MMMIFSVEWDIEPHLSQSTQCGQHTFKCIYRRRPDPFVIHVCICLSTRLLKSCGWFFEKVCKQLVLSSYNHQSDPDELFFQECCNRCLFASLHSWHEQHRCAASHERLEYCSTAAHHRIQLIANVSEDLFTPDVAPLRSGFSQQINLPLI